MLKKRFFLALIAVSMSLAGCGKNKQPEPVEEQQHEDDSHGGDGGGVASYTVSFDVQGHGVAPASQTVQSGGKVTQPQDPTEEGWDFKGWYKEAGCLTGWSFMFDTVSADTTLYAKWVEADPLSPEERANADASGMLIKMVLSFKYEEEEITAFDEAIAAYSEEIAVAETDIQGLVPYLLGAMSLDFNDPVQVIEFLNSFKEADLLDDLSYFAVATGKAFLRVESSVNEDYGFALEYVADVLDREGTEVHRNVYGLLDSALGCASLVMSEEFAVTIESVYDKEEGQISYEGLTAFVTSLSELVFEFTASYESVSYFANLLVDELINVAELVFELDEETVEALREFDIQEFVDNLYISIAMVGFALPSMMGEGSAVEYIVSIVNLALVGDWGGLFSKLLADYMALIGIEEEVYSQGLQYLFGLVIMVPYTVSAISDELSQNFFDPETGLFDKELFKDAINTVGSYIKALGQVGPYAVAFNEFVMLVVHNTLVTVFEYEEEEAAAIAAKLDFSEKILEIYGTFIEIGTPIETYDGFLFDLVEDIANGDFEEALVLLLSELIEFSGSDVKLEDFEADIGEISGVVMGIYAHLSDEEFVAKVYEAVNLETGEIDIEKLKDVLVEIVESLKDIYATKENFLNIGEKAFDVIKNALLKLGADPAMFENFDVDEFVEYVFNSLNVVLENVEAAIEAGALDNYLVAMEKIVSVFYMEDPDTIAVSYTLIDAVVGLIYAELDIQSQLQLQFEVYLTFPLLAVKSISMYLQSDEFMALLDALVVVDEETGESSIDEKAVAELLAAVANYVLNPLEASCIMLGQTVDTIREIIEKLQGEYDPEVEGETYAEIKAVLAELAEKLAEIETMLRNEEGQLDEVIGELVAYGNAILAIDSIEALLDLLMAFIAPAEEEVLIA